MKILITGATGLVGKKLVKKLVDQNHQIVILTRDIIKAQNIFNQKNIEYFSWKSNYELPPKEAFLNLDGVINLMGENIGAKKWSDTQKEKLKSSRIDSTKNLVMQINEQSPNLSFFVSASAIGIYPTNTNQIITEETTTAYNFLADLCLNWENASLGLPTQIRRVLLRTGVVLDKTDGALKKMLPPFYLGAGGILGDGSQKMSWIHIDDLVNLYAEAVHNNSINGVYNACAPKSVSNYEFTKALGYAISRPTLFPVPKFMIKTLFGEMSCIILDSQEVLPEKLMKNNYQFLYPNINLALKQIFN